MACLGAFTKSYFNGAYPLSLENGVMTIGFPEPSSSQMELADNTETNKVLIQSLKKLGQEVREIRYTIADRPADWVVAAPEKIATDDATSDAAPTTPPEGPVVLRTAEVPRIRVVPVAHLVTLTSFPHARPRISQMPSNGLAARNGRTVKWV